MFIGLCKPFLSEYINIHSQENNSTQCQSGQEKTNRESNETESNLISLAELQRICFPSVCLKTERPKNAFYYLRIEYCLAAQSVSRSQCILENARQNKYHRNTFPPPGHGSKTFSILLFT